jgi:predicted dehydrogenase
VTLTVYQNRRWDSDFLTVRRLVAGGEIGAIRRFESRFERFKPNPGPRAAGGGGLLDFGSHLVDQSLQLLGPVADVHADAHVREDGLDDDFFLALTHHSGAISHLWGSWLQGAPGPRLRVTGTTGTFVVDGMDGQEAALIAGASPASLGDDWGIEPPDRWGRLQRGGDSQSVPAERGRWDTFYPAFARAVRGETPAPVEPADAVASLRVIDAARALATASRRAAA